MILPRGDLRPVAARTRPSDNAPVVTYLSRDTPEGTSNLVLVLTRALLVGVGFWLRDPSAGVVPVAGDPIDIVLGVVAVCLGGLMGLVAMSHGAAYALQDARELGPIEVTLKPQWRWVKPGECLALELPSLDFDGDAIVLQREIDPATMKVKLTLIGEPVRPSA